MVKKRKESYYKEMSLICKHKKLKKLRRRKLHNVSNKAKERISKRVFQENKACQIFRKTNISYPLIHTRTDENHYCIDSNISKCFISLGVNWFYVKFPVRQNS